MAELGGGGHGIDSCEFVSELGGGGIRGACETEEGGRRRGGPDALDLKGARCQRGAAAVTGFSPMLVG